MPAPASLHATAAPAAPAPITSTSIRSSVAIREWPISGDGRRRQLLADPPESRRDREVIRFVARPGLALVHEVLTAHPLDLGRRGEVDRGRGPLGRGFQERAGQADADPD